MTRDKPALAFDPPHVHGAVTITMLQAALGCTVEVETLEGTRPLDIVPPVQHGDVVVRKGRGLPLYEGGRSRGDHLVRVHVEVPRELAEHHRAVLRKIAHERGEL